MPKHYRPPGKKKEGNAARYITRSQAVKELQVSLSLFRKLCILKGIFPREPKKKVKGNHHTYYHTKDILFLRHERLLDTFRDMRAHGRKIKKAEAKKNKDLVERLMSRKPTYTLDMLILERYPKFIDALRDMDDCLSMVHLFAALPATEREKIEVKRVHNCRRHYIPFVEQLISQGSLNLIYFVYMYSVCLACSLLGVLPILQKLIIFSHLFRLSHEWQAYISRTHKLRKTFISVKGIYYQAEVEGQKITWVTPHAMQQVLPDDVDYNVMLTFLEFYETLLAFVNFKLYDKINVKYPPILDPQLEALAADLYALSRYFDASSKASTVGSQAVSLSVSDQVEDQQEGKKREESELRLAQLQHQLPSNEPGALMHLVEDVAGEDDDDEETKECKNLFKNMKFFLSREVPRESLLFVIPAFGGVVSWEGEGAPYKESDQSITHQIVDRPTQGHKFLSREYVQPQWVYDCVNARIVLPTEDYMVGKLPPPHLSPFVDNEAEGYVPEYAETIKQLKAAARKEVLPMPGAGDEVLDDPQNLLIEGIIDRTEAIEAAERKRKMSALQKQYHDELKMELRGTQHSSVSNASKEKSSAEEETEAGGEEPLPDLKQGLEDAANMSKLLMSRRKRGLYDAIMIGQERKQGNVNTLAKRNKKNKEAEKQSE